MGLSIAAVTINCRDPRSLADWWAETLDEGEVIKDLGEYVFVHARRVELGFQVSRPRRGSGSAFTSTSRRTTPRRRCGGWSTEVLSSSSSTRSRRWAWRGRCCAIPRATTSAFQPQVRPLCSATPFNRFRRLRRKRRDNDSAELCVVTSTDVIRGVLAPQLEDYSDSLCNASPD